MPETAVDVTVKTRFASAQALMAVVATGIERGALRLPATIAAGRTFQIALLTATGTLLTTAGSAYSMGAKPTIGAGAGQGTSAQYFKSIGTPGFKYPI